MGKGSRQRICYFKKFSSEYVGRKSTQTEKTRFLGRQDKIQRAAVYKTIHSEVEGYLLATEKAGEKTAVKDVPTKGPLGGKCGQKHHLGVGGG